MESSSLVSALAGLVGSLSNLILYPLEFIKINIIAGDGYSKNFIPRYNSIREATKSLYSSQGFLSFYRGSHVNLFSSISWSIYFYIYSLSKSAHSDLIESYPNIFKLLTASEAAILSRIITSPLWVVKTRLILQRNSSSWYGDTTEVVKKIWITDGFTGFFAGLAPGLLLCVNGVANLYAYEVQKECFESYSPLAIGLYGINSKFFSSVISYPIQLVMIKMQQEQYSSTILQKANEIKAKGYDRKKIFTGTANCVGTVYRNEGFKGFYRGFSLQVLRTLPTNGLFFILYEETLKFFRNE
jgi:solute carrier family 25 folate transporter 32